MLDTICDIGTRMGQRIAEYMLSSGPGWEDTPWPGLEDLDPDIDNELERANIQTGTEEWQEAERAAEAAYNEAMAAGLD